MKQNFENEKPLVIQLSIDGKIKMNEMLINFIVLEKEIISLKKSQTVPKVIISTPKKTEINTLMKVMDTIRIGGIHNIALITE